MKMTQDDYLSEMLSLDCIISYANSRRQDVIETYKLQAEFKPRDFVVITPKCINNKKGHSVRLAMVAEVEIGSNGEHLYVLKRCQNGCVLSQRDYYSPNCDTLKLCRNPAGE
ncbi:hypothetical protein SAMN04515674_104254 [Pseudarcicella hirudinis]|uniref:Uncharacterized protein n=3 Tax=Pseudarcicella hirudinis TaxID=1079859 RepID=A0A1I5RVF4_9BACT|nr:hypothetical protein SAMN04515674_104254 [Pseudarcicella hirudinis]